jgi:uncharacterized protein (DUF2141 family)
VASFSVAVLSLATQQTARVSGQIAAADGRRLLGAAIMLTPIDEAAKPVPPDEVTILPDGRFTFGRVSPGRYRLRARAQTDSNGPTQFATFGLVVEGHDVANVIMTLQPGALLDGRLTVETRHRTASPLASLMVRAPLTDGSGFGDALSGRVDRSGAFAIRGLIAGPHHVLVEGLGDRWSVKSVTLRGRDITDQPFDVAGETLHDVHVTIVDAVTQLTGEVHDAQDAPARDVGVLVFSAAPQYWIPDGRRLRLVRTDDSGRFRIRGLPPGTYFAIASTSLPESRIGRLPSAVERFRAHGTAIEIAGDEATVAVSLRVISEPASLLSTR